MGTVYARVVANASVCRPRWRTRRQFTPANAADGITAPSGVVPAMLRADESVRLAARLDVRWRTVEVDDSSRSRVLEKPGQTGLGDVLTAQTWPTCGYFSASADGKPASPTRLRQAERGPPRTWPIYSRASPE